MGGVTRNEQWRHVPTMPGYLISDHGRVASFLGREIKQLRYSYTDDGYQRVRLLGAAGEQRDISVHKLVLETFVGPRPEGMECRHLDGNKLNNRLENLCWGTPSENSYDRVRHGTHPMANKTHCLRGHPFDVTNTSHTADGRRRCRECARMYSRTSQERRLSVSEDAA